MKSFDLFLYGYHLILGKIDLEQMDFSLLRLSYVGKNISMTKISWSYINSHLTNLYKRTKVPRARPPLSSFLLTLISLENADSKETQVFCYYLKKTKNPQSIYPRQNSKSLRSELFLISDSKKWVGFQTFDLDNQIKKV